MSAAQHTTSAQRLARQKADFTAEGSPPPGRVATAVPATPEAEGEAAAQRAARKP